MTQTKLTQIQATLTGADGSKVDVLVQDIEKVLEIIGAATGTSEYVGIAEELVALGEAALHKFKGAATIAITPENVATLFVTKTLVDEPAPATPPAPQQ
ncbi:MAG TPA: hypothetical protein VFA71_03785 [Terriglobales bacterium]|nr:hypothetical protein [Terriglobales bacterium]